MTAKSVRCMQLRSGRAKRRAYPLVGSFWFTGEEPNPWRCGLCVTSGQRARARQRHMVVTVPAVCCRKCGMEID
jgi:hypothetical protein